MIIDLSSNKEYYTSDTSTNPLTDLSHLDDDDLKPIDGDEVFETFYGNKHKCKQKLSTCHLFAETRPGFFLCVKSTQTGEVFLYGDTVHFPQFDSTETEMIWIFVGGEVIKNDHVVLFFIDQRYYVGGSNTKPLHLIMVSVYAFREQVDKLGNQFRDHFDRPEYFIEDDFMNSIAETTNDFCYGQFANDIQKLSSSKFRVIGILKLKPKKARQNHEVNLTTSSYTATHSRKAALEQRKKEKQLEEEEKAEQAVAKALLDKSKTKKSTPIKETGSKKRTTAFILFADEYRPSIRKANPNIAFTAMGALLGEEWRKLSDEQKVLIAFTINNSFC